MIKLLLSDVDGTLVRADKSLAPSTVDAVHALHDTGIHVAVTSGRSPRGMEMLVEPLSLEAPLAGFNGGLVVEPDLEVLAERLVPDEIVPDAIELLESCDLSVWAYRGPDWLVLDPQGPHVEREAHTVQFEPRVVGRLDDVRGVATTWLTFARSGLSIAMGNAHREVQRAARHITTTNDEDGFANAVRRFILDGRS